MLNQYFGQYLLNNGILKAEQLYDAINAEQSVRIKIGVLAINAGYMTAEQVEKVHALQYAKDRRFGEMALEQGYLTGAQLDELLTSQEQRSLTLSQVIIDKGYLTLEQLEKALESYRAEAQLSAEQFKALQSMDFDAAVRILADFSSSGTNADLFYDYAALLLRNIVRFLNEIPVPGLDSADGNLQCDWLACQEIRGEVTLFTGLAMDDDVLLKIAQRYSGEKLDEIDELARDSVAEFLNVNNGIFCVNLSENGLEADMLPQETRKELPASIKKIAHMNIKTSLGQFTLLLGTP